MKYEKALENKKRGSSHKLLSYFENYDFHFGQLDREKKYNILEIGVQEGGGLWTLKEYFPNSSITGLDIDIECKQHEDKNNDVEVFSGCQMDEDLLEKIHQARGPFDIIIDDGGHTMKQQKTSFLKLFPLMNNNSLYVIEDLHTSYWPEFNDDEETTMDFLKRLSGNITARWATRDKAEKGRHSLDFFSQNIKSIHFYDSICFIDKKGCSPPEWVII